jgi:hypothetical protein
MAEDEYDPNALDDAEAEGEEYQHVSVCQCTQGLACRLVLQLVCSCMHISFGRGAYFTTWLCLQWEATKQRAIALINADQSMLEKLSVEVSLSRISRRPDPP